MRLVEREADQFRDQQVATHLINAGLYEIGDPHSEVRRNSSRDAVRINFGFQLNALDELEDSDPLIAALGFSLRRKS